MVEISRDKLDITISNSKPMNLADLSLALSSICALYERYAVNASSHGQEVPSEILLKEVRHGSIILELATRATPFAPLFMEGGSIYQWTVTASNIVAWLLGKIDTPPVDVDRKDLECYRYAMEPIAKDNGSQINLTATGSSNQSITININSHQANEIQNRATRAIDAICSPDNSTRTRQALYWHQVKFDQQSTTGDKAIIDGISRAAVKAIFDPPSIKQEMLKGSDRFNKPWQDLVYIVDVEVQTVRGMVKIYKIIRFYPEDTFDPDE